MPPRLLVSAALIAAVAGCHPVRPRGTNGDRSSGRNVTLTVLPAESDRFPDAAQAITESLSDADVSGIGKKQVSKVSLEIVQLSIECVEATVGCYTKVGESLATNRLLFAQIAPDRKRLKVTVTLFDVDARSPRTVHRVFASEKEAREKIGELVSEATR